MVMETRQERTPLLFLAGIFFLLGNSVLMMKQCQAFSIVLAIVRDLVFKSVRDCWKQK